MASDAMALDPRHVGAPTRPTSRARFSLTTALRRELPLGCQRAGRPRPLSGDCRSQRGRGAETGLTRVGGALAVGCILTRTAVHVESADVHSNTTFPSRA